MTMSRIQLLTDICSRVTAQPLASSNSISINDVCNETFRLSFGCKADSPPQTTTYPAEDIEDVSGDGQIFVPYAIHGVSNRVGQQQANANELQQQADGEQSRHRMLLQSHRVDLQRNHHQVDDEKDQIHLQGVLLIEGEVK